MASPLEARDERAAGDELAAPLADEHGVLTPNGVCRRCDAPVAWVKTARGKKLPLDPEPSRSPLEGNFGLTQYGTALYVRDAARMAAFGADGASCEYPIYVAHFASCRGQR